MVVKFVAEVAMKTSRRQLLETMTVFIKYENSSTSQRSESREVAQFAADKMIRLFLKEGSDDVKEMKHYWRWARMQIDFPDINFLRDTLYPFYGFALPRAPLATAKRATAAADPVKKLCVHFVSLFNERWVENTTYDPNPCDPCDPCSWYSCDPTLACDPCNSCVPTLACDPSDSGMCILRTFAAPTGLSSTRR